MGRYSVESTLANLQQTPLSHTNWPSQFPKQAIGIDRNGIIIKNDREILSPSDIEIQPHSLEAIKVMRLKGYKVFIFFNEPNISKNKISIGEVENINNEMLKLFGQAGIFSIEGIFYSGSTSRQDEFAMPNTGMIKKAESEYSIKFRGGYFVGDSVPTLKAGFQSGTVPVFIKTENYSETVSKINTFANRELKSKIKEFENLLEFANSLN